MKLASITSRAYVKCKNDSERKRVLKLLSLLHFEVDDKLCSFELAPYIAIDVLNNKAFTITDKSAMSSIGVKITNAAEFINDNL